MGMANKDITNSVHVVYNFVSDGSFTPGKDGDNAKFTKALDYLQQNLKCCGEYGFDDYMSPNASNWFSNNFGVSLKLELSTVFEFVSSEI